MGWIGILGPLFEALGGIVSSIVEQASKGDTDGAQARVDFFVAVSQAELDGDRAEAERLLRARFQHAGEFEEPLEDIYADLKDLDDEYEPRG